MAYPSRNTSTYSSPSKNSSTSTNSEQSWQEFLMIDDTYFLLIENTFKILIEPNSTGYTYQSKS